MLDVSKKRIGHVITSSSKVCAHVVDCIKLNQAQSKRAALLELVGRRLPLGWPTGRSSAQFITENKPGRKICVCLTCPFDPVLPFCCDRVGLFTDPCVHARVCIVDCKDYRVRGTWFIVASEISRGIFKP
jgi:hypothetical protein